MKEGVAKIDTCTCCSHPGASKCKASPQCSFAPSLKPVHQKEIVPRQETLIGKSEHVALSSHYHTSTARASLAAISVSGVLVGFFLIDDLLRFDGHVDDGRSCSIFEPEICMSFLALHRADPKANRTALPASFDLSVSNLPIEISRIDSGLEGFASHSANHDPLALSLPFHCVGHQVWHYLPANPAISAPSTCRSSC